MMTNGPPCGSGAGSAGGRCLPGACACRTWHIGISVATGAVDGEWDSADIMYTIDAEVKRVGLGGVQ